MQKLSTFFKVLSVVFGIAILIVAIFITFDKAYFNWCFIINPDLASKFGSFFGGFIGTLFSIMSIFLLIYTIITQNIENSKNNVRTHFFKMLDFHNENLRNIRVPSLEKSKGDIKEEGRRAFVVYKIQLQKLLDAVKIINNENNFNLTDTQIIDISYIFFYYGMDERWVKFIEDKLSFYPKGKLITELMLQNINNNKELLLGRTNQTELSSYFRNMYNSIKLVHESKSLSNKEKLDLIKIYRAQLSNPELYILFFNLVSRFGQKWKNNQYIEKYEFITNLPKMYCDGYNIKDFFDIQLEEDELKPDI